MAKSKRAQVEIQFNWIFVLIVGAILLAFFTTVALKQKQTSERALSADFFNSLKNSLSELSNSPGTTLPIKINNVDLGYGCIKGSGGTPCSCGYYSGKSRSQSSSFLETADVVSFSPNYLKGTHLIITTKEWAFPFRIGNFVLMTSPEIKYLIEDTPEGKAIYEELPDKKMKEFQKDIKGMDKDLFVPEEKIENLNGNYKIRFVFTSADPEQSGFEIPKEITALPEDVSAVYLDYAKNKVYFYEMDSASSKFKAAKNSYLLGDSTVYAAIFSEDAIDYSCKMNDALRNFAAVYSIQFEKRDYYWKSFGCDRLAEGRINGVPMELGRNATCCIDYGAMGAGTSISLEGFDLFTAEDQDVNNLVYDLGDFAKFNEKAIKDGCPNVY